MCSNLLVRIVFLGMLFVSVGSSTEMSLTTKENSVLQSLDGMKRARILAGSVGYADWWQGANPDGSPVSIIDIMLWKWGAHDDLVGYLKYAPADTFIQGAPVDEPCGGYIEDQFSHTLTRNLLVMETEVTRQMWADLKAVQTDLPEDPSDTSYGDDMYAPVQNLTWYEAVLFANLLSIQQGFIPCYYTDAAMTIPIDAGNYVTDEVTCDFDASGYRLPMEGEWEYVCRAGTTGPFSIDEPAYTDSSCASLSCTPGVFPNLETVCVFCNNSSLGADPAGSKSPNPWGLKDVHGNVAEMCWDWSAPYPEESVTNYTGPASGTSRVCRGGHWYERARYCRSAGRNGLFPSNRNSLIGFRLLRTKH